MKPEPRPSRSVAHIPPVALHVQGRRQRRGRELSQRRRRLRAGGGFGVAGVRSISAFDPASEANSKWTDPWWVQRKTEPVMSSAAQHTRVKNRSSECHEGNPFVVIMLGCRRGPTEAGRRRIRGSSRQNSGGCCEDRGCGVAGAGAEPATAARPASVGGRAACDTASAEPLGLAIVGAGVPPRALCDLFWSALGLKGIGPQARPLLPQFGRLFEEACIGPLFLS